MTSDSFPHFLLIAEARSRGGVESGGHEGDWSAGDLHEGGIWRFQLQALAGDDHFSAAGSERQMNRDRLELLAVLRGLEALDQPSQVTLLTASRYVRRGLRQGLHQWRNNDWHWERFGRRAPVKNHDLWRRVATALEFHRVDCRLWRIDQPASEPRQPFIPRPHSRRLRPTAESCKLEELQLAAG